MHAQEQTNPQDEAQKQWAQLDAEEAGTAAPPIPGEIQSEKREPETATPPAPAAQADASKEDSGLTAREQELLDTIAGLKASQDQLASRLRNAEGHIGGLTNQLKQQTQVAQQVKNEGGQAPTAAEIRSAQGDPEAMASLKRDYPEFATAMESVLNERLSEIEQRFKQAPAPQAPAGVGPEELQQLRAELQVEMQHPGWQKTVKTPEFQGWLLRQPREVQMLAVSDDPQDAARLLDIHGENTKAATTQRTQRLTSAAALPTGRAGAPARQKAFEDMTPQEQWRYLDELDKSKG